MGQIPGRQIYVFIRFAYHQQWLFTFNLKFADNVGIIFRFGLFQDKIFNHKDLLSLAL